MNAGCLIAFEGIDGCGKSTQVERLVATLRKAGRDVVATAEPTQGEWGRRIREMARSGEAVPAEEELRWFTLDRREHVAELIAPNLAAGRVVVTDRYYLSTVAYQGAHGLDWRHILSDSESEFPQPDLVLLLEIGVREGLSRVHERASVLESVFEDADRLARVAEIFSALELRYLERVAAAEVPAQVEATIAAVVQRRLGLASAKPG